MTESPLTVSVPEFTLTDRLRKARDKAGFTQAGLARALGIGRSSLAAYESGKNETPRKVVLAWAMCTRVPPAWLADGDTGTGPNNGGEELLFDQFRRGPQSGSLDPRKSTYFTLITPAPLTWELAA
jgi:transcriptional regulator with XRE-family HTH domain